jgi:hypothetical protein
MTTTGQPKGEFRPKKKPDITARLRKMVMLFFYKALIYNAFFCFNCYDIDTCT